MKIRSVTSFVEVESNGVLSDSKFLTLQKFNQAVKRELKESDYEIQSLRCATNPFPEYLGGLSQTAMIQKVQQLEKDLLDIGYGYISVGTAMVEHIDLYPVVPEIMGATEAVFATAQMASMSKSMISMPAIKAIAKIMKQLSTQDENGFGNLFFAALAKVPGGIPFLPSAYKSSNDHGLSFSLAMESADLAVTAFASANTLTEASENYISTIETESSRIEEIVRLVGEQFGMTFLGFDFTPAPFIALESSAGGALERLTGASIGELSSVSAAAFLMSALDAANFRRSGFNGLMLPVLEDSVLAMRAAEGKLTLKDLLLYSTVCGTGLDTVPLPGDITEGQLQAILLDVASLAVRLNKPLTARLMPIPGKKAGDKTSFDFPFFTNSKVMAPECSGMSGLVNCSDEVLLKPRY